MQAGLATVLAGVAVGLALVGLYGLMGSVVGRREREFGIRAALGATPATVARLVFRHAGRLALAGVAVGLGVSLAAAQGLADLLYGVDARDPLTFAVVTLALGAAVMTACVAPARRAARVDPVDVLRAE